MSRLDDLPPDQRAVLLLLVRRGKSHAEIAEMLGITRTAVGERASAALEALADEPSGPRGNTSAPRPAPEPAPAPSRGAGLSSSLPSSRRGGALLLAALVVIVVVAVILISGGGDSHRSSGTQAASAATTVPSPTSTGASGSSTTSSTAGKPTKQVVNKQIALTSADPNSKTVGLVEVLSEGSKRAFYIAAEHLPPSSGFFYAVWLYNSPTSSAALGKIPPVKSNGQAQGGALLPANAGIYHKILLTRETNPRATQPGQVVLSGAFSLGH